MAKWMILGAALALGAAGGAAAQERPLQLAQVMPTPVGCHWIDAGDRVQDLWCRDADGRARRTSTSRRDDRDVADAGCPRGRIYDGASCVAEAEVLARRTVSWPPLAPTPQPRRQRPPEVFVMGDNLGYGGEEPREAWVLHRPEGSSVAVMTRVPLDD